MAPRRCIIFLGLLAGATAVDVTPIEKVISLIEGLKKEVEEDSKSEAEAYDKFACFCKDTTEKKSDSVKKGTDEIKDLSADIADKTQVQREESTELGERKKMQEELSSNLDATTARCAKEKAEYEAEAADLSKAIQGLKDAIKAMKDSKPSSFLAIKQTLGKTFEEAEAMSLLKTPKRKAVAAFLQQSTAVDPSDPEYDFHSDDIIEVCENLLQDYKGTKKELDEEWMKTDKGCKEMKASLKKKMKANDDTMKDIEKHIQKLKEEIAAHREDLVNAQAVLQDDELYLKDMQVRCEDRANDYDQRSAMRGDELAALKGALQALKEDVKDRADEVNKRAFFIQKVSGSVPSQAPGASSVKVDAPAAGIALKSISFLQDASSSGRSRTFLGLTSEARKTNALALIRKEGQRIGSLALASLAERAAADPFKKVKGLIQRLIERLLEESKAEATKKGFCDTELGKARTDRDNRWVEANDLSAELAKLEATEEKLVAEIKALKRDIKDETEALKETAADRKDEKEENMKTLRTAKEGLDGVNEALLILRTFYKQAAKAAFVQASPVDEDTKGPGFVGSYKGKQSGSKAVFALLETIASDFDRTLRKTEEAENRAHRDFVEYSQTAKASIAGKETKKKLDEQDLETTRTSIKTNFEDLQTAMDLLDKALQELEELKPACMDSGMSYLERVKKREEEMAALKKALCILDEEGVEPECV